MTSDQEALQGIDVDKVGAWLAANVEGAVAPFTYSLISGGHSNLTYGVTDAAGNRFVFRRPPLGQVLASAHDMAREARIMKALDPTAVPVPSVVGVCEDVEVNGAPFYVMRFVDGLILRTAAETTEQLTETARRTAGLALADTLAAIHAVDPDEVGLGSLGKKEDYITRQLKRWYRQFQASNELTGRPVPLVHEVHDFLAARIPEQVGASIVHGDYRLDNAMISPDGEVIAVLDWEICTLGDPLADLGLLHVYWTEATDEVAALPGSPTTVAGFPSRAELVARYAEVSGRDLTHLDFYIAFGYWKLACIIEGVYSRYASGAMGQAEGYEAFEQQVLWLADSARRVADKLR